MTPTTTPNQIRAVYDEKSIRVYQAYNDAIADTALAAGTFVSPPFSMTRMTWIKPSFLWMMYRAGWGYKDPGQNRILAIDITHDGFKWALQNSCGSKPDPSKTKEEWTRHKLETPVRIQWDPERDLWHNPLPHRAIQIGLTGIAVKHYVENWIQNITDITDMAQDIHGLVKSGRIEDAKQKLPLERVYSAD